MSADFYSLEMGSSNYLPLLRSMDSPGQTVSLKSEKFEINGSWPSGSGLIGCRRTYLTILKRAWSANSKMVRLVLL
jgi:hypothetical protein